MGHRPPPALPREAGACFLSVTGLLLALAAPHGAAPQDPHADEKIAALRALAPSAHAPDEEIEPPLDPIGGKADPSRPVK